MIAYLEGTIVEYETDAVILNVAGVGYRVFSTRLSALPGETVKLFISEVIREDRHDLYGFVSKEERQLFVLLTNVQGVGPKIGQKILSATSVENLRKYIQAGDISFFTSISGVGKKTAQKIILDLKGVLVADEAGQAKVVRDDVTDALENLGYSRDDIAAVIPHVTGETSEERVKSALRMIGKK